LAFATSRPPPARRCRSAVAGNCSRRTALTLGIKFLRGRYPALRLLGRGSAARPLVRHSTQSGGTVEDYRHPRPVRRSQRNALV